MSRYIILYVKRQTDKPVINARDNPSGVYFFPIFLFFPSISRYVVYRYLGIFDVQFALTPVSAFSFLSLLLFTFTLFLFFVFILSFLSCARPPHFVLCSRVPRAILPLVGLCAPPPLARFSVSFVLFLSSFPSASFFFSAGLYPASSSSIVPDVIRLRAVYLRCSPSLNMPIPA